MNALIAASVARTRLILSFLLLLLVAGLYAYVVIPKESFPDISQPLIYVRASLEGVSPQDAERLLARPMEQELRTVDGVKEVRSDAYEGGAGVTLEFVAGSDPDKALDEVRARLDRIRTALPDDASDPTVAEFTTTDFPVVSVMVSGKVPERTLLDVATRLRDEIQKIDTVLEADIAGKREEMVLIEIDPRVIESYGLQPAQLVNLFNMNNRLVAAGNLDTGEGRFALKVPGLLQDLDDILNLPLKTDGGAVVHFRDVASITRAFKDPGSFARVDGQTSLTIDVKKRTGTNLIETVEHVKAIVAAARGMLPPEVKIAFTGDQSREIRTMISDLENNIVSAVLLIMVVVVAALGFRSGLFVGVAIPGSFLTGILVLYLSGLTVNMVMLFALILAVGMLVDGAIIVTEFADRKLAEGLPAREAYRLAAQRMAWPIVSATATTVAAFAPLLFWPGIVGEFMKYLPITLIAVLAASIVMSLIFVPTLGAMFGRPGSADRSVMKALAVSEGGNLRELRGLTGRYVRLLDLVLRHPAKFVATMVALLIGVWVVYAQYGKGVEFFPEVEPDQAAIVVHARGNLSIHEMDALVREVEAEVLAVDARQDEMESVYTRVGGSGDVIGRITLRFREWDERRPADEILEEIRTRTARLAGILVRAEKQEAGPGAGKPISIQLAGRDMAALEAALQTVRSRLGAMPGVVDIEDNGSLPGIDWAYSIDRAMAARFGLDVTTAGQMFRLVTNGMAVGSYRPDDTTEELDVIIRYPEANRSLEELERMRIVTPAGSVPLSNFLTREPQPKTGTINRVDGQRVLTVTAGVQSGVLPDDVVRQLEAWLPEAGIDPSVKVSFRGENQEQAEAQAFLSKAFLVALFLIAMILVAQFNSFYQTFLILTAVIMSTAGVLIGLLVRGQPFGIVMSGIGVVALAGVVVNNNIVLIDTFNVIRRQVGDAREAILRTGAQRLRPVFLTTLTTILGLLPMMFQLNIDFFTRSVSHGAPSTQFWVQLSTAIVFGLAFSTILTLIFTPSALMLQANIGAWRRRRRDRRTAGKTTSDKSPPPLSEAAE